MTLLVNGTCVIRFFFGDTFRLFCAVYIPWVKLFINFENGLLTKA